jgi:hypothetical protein
MGRAEMNTALLMMCDSPSKCARAAAKVHVEGAWLQASALWEEEGGQRSEELERRDVLSSCP